jgi:hypothetical protein
MVRAGRRPFRSWEEWRVGIRRPLLRPSCGLCWGQGAIYEPFLGGGLIPVQCEGCRGTGRT